MSFTISTVAAVAAYKISLSVGTRIAAIGVSVFAMCMFAASGGVYLMLKFSSTPTVKTEEAHWMAFLTVIFGSSYVSSMVSSAVMTALWSGYKARTLKA